MELRVLALLKRAVFVLSSTRKVTEFLSITSLHYSIIALSSQKIAVRKIPKLGLS